MHYLDKLFERMENYYYDQCDRPEADKCIWVFFNRRFVTSFEQDENNN